MTSHPLGCSRIEEHELLERYVRGELDESARDALELHLLDCERCSTDLRLLLELPPLLGSTAARRPKRTLPWFAAAAVLVLLVAGMFALRGIPEEALPAELLRVEPPSYAPMVLRGAGEAEREFREAMEHYSAGRYGQAIPGLERSDAAAPDEPAIELFLGACYLLDGRLADARRVLGQAARRVDSPFADEARFYLAKAHVRAGDLEAAIAEWKALDAGGGAWAGEARRMLELAGG